MTEIKKDTINLIEGLTDEECREVRDHIRHLQDEKKRREKLNLPKQRVAVYCRHSSDSDMEDNARKAVRLITENPKWTLTEVYSNQNGSDQKAALHRMIRDAEDDKFDMVVIEKMSRLSRNLADCMKVVGSLRELPNPVGVQVLDVDMNSLDMKFDIFTSIQAMVEQEEQVRCQQ